MKYCIDCKNMLSENNFYKAKTSQDGLESFCKNCRKKRNKKWVENNKVKHSKLVHDRYMLKRDDRLSYSQQYYQDNKTEHLKRSAEWHRNAYKTDPKFKLRILFSNAIRGCLKGRKTSSWLDYVSYNLDELKFHLESQFDENMNWDNYGSYWEVDHIRPISSFTFSDPFDNQFQECWALKNLRPLYWLENNKKSNKYQVEE